MSKIEMTKVNGKYAELRVKFLEEHAPNMLEAMINDGSLYEHLDFVQSLVNQYIDKYVDKSKQSAPYKKAESECDLAEMNNIITTAQIIAETDAGAEWIYTLPDANDETAEEDKSYDDMSYDEAVLDIYNDISKAKSAISELEEESEEE